MLKINKELNQTPEMTFVAGEYNGKPFEMNYHLDGSYKVSGNFTYEEKLDIASDYIIGAF